MFIQTGEGSWMIVTHDEDKLTEVHDILNLDSCIQLIAETSVTESN